MRHIQPGAAFFPAVSISHGEQCELNLGARPLRYPVEGYAPIQDPPAERRQQAAEYLLTSLQRLVRLSIPSSSTTGAADGPAGAADVGMADADAAGVHAAAGWGQIFSKDDYILLAAAIAEHLTPLLLSLDNVAPRSYLLSAYFVPFLQVCRCTHQPARPPTHLLFEASGRAKAGLTCWVASCRRSWATPQRRAMPPCVAWWSC